MPAAPYPPLLAGGDVLQAPPMSAAVLRQRMAEVYSVRAECVLPVRGKWHGVGLVMRLVRGAVAAPGSAEFERTARANGAMLAADAPARFMASPDVETGETLSADAVKRAASELEFLVVDESLIEFADAPSLAGLACDAPNLIVLRDLGQAYGLAGEPCAALIADAALIARLEDLLEPDALSTPAIRAALAVLDPAKAAAYARRFAEVRAEKARIVAALEAALGGGAVEAREGPLAICAVRDPEATQREIARYRADVSVRDGRAFIRIGAPEVNDRALAALGGQAAVRARRRSEVVRETLETRIAVSVDLDTEGQSDIATGVGFYDHMLSQIAAHGGFSVVLRCQGDLEIDTHHTIEDCALALGDALKQALGDRRGIGRFGFVLPMDEAEAKVSIDLGGRPFLVFDAQFTAPTLGEYPVEMTEHVFRSLSQTMGASIHVSVTGENDHHKTEACFKAFGRALRQAVRIEGASLPSTKGMLA